MMTDYQLNETIERYLNGDLEAEEKVRFETLCQENPAVNKQVTDYVHFTGLIKQYGERVELESRLNAIHQEIDVHTLIEQVTERPNWIVQLWHNHHSKISVAASIAVFAVLSTLFATGYLNKDASNIQPLRREVENYRRTTESLNRSTKALLNDIKSGKKVINPGKFGGTGFALTANGYVVTNNHVINGADSLYVQNSAGEAFHAKLIYTEPAYDIAVLKIDDPTFKTLSPVPYNFKKSGSDLGEDVFTVGYPSDSIVLGKGYLSSATGFNGDTLAYRVSIPVNPGNSGGPLLDSRGNVIGIISGKQTQMDGAAFAVKTGYLMQALHNIPTDSVSKKLSLNNNKNVLSGLNRIQQIKKLRNYVFMVKVYN